MHGTTNPKFLRRYLPVDTMSRDRKLHSSETQLWNFKFYRNVLDNFIIFYL